MVGYQCGVAQGQRFTEPVFHAGQRSACGACTEGNRMTSSSELPVDPYFMEWHCSSTLITIAPGLR